MTARPVSAHRRYRFQHANFPRRHRRVLKEYTGPYEVGFLEIEAPVASPQQFSDPDDKTTPTLRLDTVLLSVYYPSSLPHSVPRDLRKEHPRVPWLSHPRWGSAKGWSTSMYMGSTAAPLIDGTTRHIKIPAYQNAQVADFWPSKNKGEKGMPPDGEADLPRFPVIIFSHGLGGNRSVYSSLIGEFASYGFVVCALEHRDGTSARSYINYPPGREPPDVGSEKKNYRKADYWYSKVVPHDTRPENSGAPDKALRRSQIDLRLSEIEEAYRILSLINEGSGSQVADQNLRGPGFHGGTRKGLSGVDWDAWKGRLDVEHATMMGHSFGAATTVVLMRNQSRFPWCWQGVALDVWSIALKAFTPPYENDIDRPLLSVTSEAFMYFVENFSMTHHLSQQVINDGAPSYLLTVRGSGHISPTDFPLLFPKTCSYMFKTLIDPAVAVELNVDAALEFLARVGHGSTAELLKEGRRNEELLDMECVDELPMPRRPSRNLALTLKRPSKFKRVRHKIAQKVRDREFEDDRLRPQKGIWMHIASTREEVKAYRERTHRGRPSAPRAA